MVEHLQPVDENEKSREVRLGLVLYGGVSLAIYIYGVSLEFFRAVRGQGIYRLIKALTDSDVVVDILSGTSAGGINGILLAYALCNERDLNVAAPLWRTHGGIAGLLRAPWNDQNGYQSILNSEGYYEPKLCEAFRDLYETRYDPDPLDDPSPITELDLFVTGTDVEGSVYTQFDDAGHPIDVKEHRAVFLLKHRAGRKEQFNPLPSRGADASVTYAALAKLSRITSCFPAAFAPVSVGDDEGGEETVDGKLKLWGKLDGAAYFLDGGVLDNKPFTHTIKAIFSRAATKRVERRLFFVEPDPERFKADAVRAASPNPVQAVVASLIGIPGYESIAEDLRLIAERNSKIMQYNRVVRDLCGSGAMPAAPSEETKKLYERSRMVVFSERIVRGIFRAGVRNTHVAPEDRDRASDLVRQFDALEISAGKVFEQLDVDFRLRRLYRLVYLIYELLYEGATISTERGKLYQELWPVLNRQIELYEILRSAMESLIDEADIPWKEQGAGDVWTKVYTALCALVSVVPVPEGFERWTGNEWSRRWLTNGDLESARKALANQAVSIVERFATLSWPSDGVLQRIDEAEQKLLAAFLPAEDLVRRAYERFADLDAHLFPLEMVGGLTEKDVIETVRISPLDADKGFSRRSLDQKVAGDALHHFGGFFKRSWRSNDILWGRLDGLCQLVETLLDEKRLRQIAASPASRRLVRARFFDADGSPRQALRLEVLFPSASEETRRKCDRWLRGLLSDDAAAREEALKDHAELVELLIEAAQLEVLRTDLPRVVEDAVAEQGEWNRYEVDATASGAARNGSTPPASGDSPYSDSSPWRYKAGRARVDRLVGGLAASDAAQASIARLTGQAPAKGRPSESPLGNYFRTGYQVGSEEVRKDVPMPVLLEIVSTALLVLRNCVLQIFGPEAARIRRHPLFVFGFNLPLLAFHAIVRLWRRASWIPLVSGFFALAVSLIVLTIGWYWSDELFWPRDRGYQPAAILWLLALPLLVFLLSAFALAEYGRGRWWLLRVVIDLLGVAAVAALVGTLVRRNAELLAGSEWLRVAILLVFVALPGALLVLRIVLSLAKATLRERSTSP
jgi:predicted acylesterase/phospholipase RssA